MEMAIQKHRSLRLANDTAYEPEISSFFRQLEQEAGTGVRGAQLPEFKALNLDTQSCSSRDCIFQRAKIKFRRFAKLSRKWLREK